MSEETTATGQIVFYAADQGYGYLRLTDSLEEFHFRTRNLAAGPVSKGDPVTFLLRQNRQGWFADRVRLLT